MRISSSAKSWVIKHYTKYRELILFMHFVFRLIFSRILTQAQNIGPNIRGERNITVKIQLIVTSHEMSVFLIRRCVNNESSFIARLSFQFVPCQVLF